VVYFILNVCDCVYCSVGYGGGWWPVCELGVLFSCELRLGWGYLWISCWVLVFLLGMSGCGIFLRGAIFSPPWGHFLGLRGV